MTNRIEILDNIKEKITYKRYNNSKELELEIDRLIELFWYKEKAIRNEDLFDMDLKELSSFHNYLLNKVEVIHESEICAENKKNVEESTNVKDSVKNSLDSKMGHKIYSFNKERDYVFVGDLHSDDQSLKRVLSDVNFFDDVINEEKQVLIFNGDYVDRGHTHFKILERLLIIKYLFPTKIFLLRGNHDGGIIKEDGTIKLPYRVFDYEDKNLYFPLYVRNLTLENDTLEPNMLKSYLDFFNTLSYIAFVNVKEETIMSVHGGIPRPNVDGEDFYDYINSIKDLTDETIVDSLDRTMCQNIMWCDPYKGGEYKENVGRYHYKVEHLLGFMKKFKVDFLIRGHEAVEEGYRFDLDDNVITIFSSGILDENKEKTTNSESAYEEVTPRVLKIKFTGEREII